MHWRLYWSNTKHKDFLSIEEKLNTDILRSNHDDGDKVHVYLDTRLLSVPLSASKSDFFNTSSCWSLLLLWDVSYNCIHSQFANTSIVIKVMNTYEIHADFEKNVLNQFCSSENNKLDN